MTQPRDWVSFWNAPHSIYVSQRHLDVHYRLIAEHVARLIVRERAGAGLLAPDAVVLDYGCGEALHAAVVAVEASRLILCDAAPRVREALAQRFAHDPRIAVRSPEEIEALEGGSLDIIVMVSVTQYLDPAVLDRLLALFRRLLKPTGLLTIGDVVPPAVSPLVDAYALLRMGFRHGFLGAALAGLVRTTFSPYRRLRATLGLTRYPEAAMAEKLAQAGFAAERLAMNLGHNPTRMTFIARPR